MTINNGGPGLKAVIELLAVLVGVFVIIALIRVGYIVVEGRDDPTLTAAVNTLLAAVVAAISAVLLRASR